MALADREYFGAQELKVEDGYTSALAIADTTGTTPRVQMFRW
jgi:hypothetical protein